MNNTFDIKRLGMVMRWDLLTQWKGYAFSTLACIIAYSLYSLVWLNKLKGTVMFDGTPFGTQNHYVAQEAVFFGLMCFVAFYVMASCIFSNLRTKTNRESFLMLPASNKEKYLARLLMMSIGSLVELVIILFATDAIQLAFSYIINPGFHTSISLPVLSKVIDTPMFTRWGEGDVIFLTCLLFNHSFCTLGGTFYRKMAPLLTFVTGLVLFLVLGYVANWMGNAGIFNFHISITFGEGNSYIFTSVLCTILLVLTVFNYWASYKIFTRMQLISNKWINI